MKISNKKNAVHVCNDITFLNSYINTCTKANFIIELLLCETNKPYPMCTIKAEDYENKLIFIGYDYGYSGGDYYSCVFNDTHRIKEMTELKLNNYGLFETEEELIDFIKIRDMLKSKYSKNMFEQGEFIIYKIFKYIGELPISDK